MKDKQVIVGTLGQMLYQAARASVAKGAIYDPGENISQDAEAAWKGIAETIVNLVEQTTSGKEVQRGEGT